MECGVIWFECHQEPEVRRMRDRHIDTILRRSEVQGMYENCSLVQEYRLGMCTGSLSTNESQLKATADQSEGLNQGNLRQAHALRLICTVSINERTGFTK